MTLSRNLNRILELNPMNEVNGVMEADTISKNAAIPKSLMWGKVFLVLLVVVLTTGYAQAQFSFGLTSGMNITDVKLIDFDNSASYKNKPEYDNGQAGVRLGLIGEYALSKNFAIHSGILYDNLIVYPSATKTYGGHYSMRYNLGILQIPLNIQYNLDLGVIVPFLQAGTHYYFDIDFDQPEKRRFGCNFGGGLQFGNLQLGYNIAFYNNYYDSFPEATTKINLTSHSIGLTYFFSRKRPSSHRKYPVPDNLSTPYTQTITVPNTPAKEISKKVRLYQISQSPRNTISPMKTEKDQMGYSIGIYKPYRPGSTIYTVNNYQLFINQDQLKINTLPVVSSQYITASRRNKYHKKLKTYDKRYNAGVENLKSYRRFDKNACWWSNFGR